MMKSLAGKIIRPFQACVFWSCYTRHARRLRLDRLYFILSFDCDTPEDAAAAARLDPWLRARGVKVTYAVPGVQLRQNADVYRRLAESGAEFINHGALPHTERRGDRYWSITFYHQMAPADVMDDIRCGHAIVTEVIGRVPVGFRAPHFGLFQQPAQLQLQYDTLRALGYRYSTSTVPAFAMRHGPVFDVGGLYEVPLSGTYRRPLTIFDSWGHVVSPQRPMLKPEYAGALRDTVDHLLAARIPAVLNCYVDPAHVAEGGVFCQAIEYLVARRVPALDYGELLSLATRL